MGTKLSDNTSRPRYPPQNEAKLHNKGSGPSPPLKCSLRCGDLQVFSHHPHTPRTRPRRGLSPLPNFSLQAEPPFPWREPQALSLPLPDWGSQEITPRRAEGPHPASLHTKQTELWPGFTLQPPTWASSHRVQSPVRRRAPLPPPCSLGSPGAQGLPGSVNVSVEVLLGGFAGAHAIPRVVIGEDVAVDACA